MDYASFQRLHEFLKDGILHYIRQSDSSQNYSLNPRFFIHNGNITTEIHLACALRYFAGGSYLDITMSHAIGVTDFYLSVWAVVDATNRCPSLNFQFPTTESECQAISTKSAARSKAGFTNCIGYIDGLLIWLEKPSKKQCEQVGVDTGKFYCGRKGKFGLNFQGFCDARRQFTYISIQHPASALDYLSFATSSLYGYLTNETTRLPSGYCLYGDNAYVNDTLWQFHIPIHQMDPKMRTTTFIGR